jgi:flagellar hook-associated protein 2
MATITSLGIGTNGLDTETLVTQLVQSQRTPIVQLQERTKGLQTQLSAYGKVQSALATLRDAAAKLTRPDSWAASVASSTDATSVAVSAGTATVAGNFAVSVSKLATSQTVASAALPVSPGTIGTGSITIELGTWDAGQTGFTAKSGATAVTINIAPGEDQLTQIRDKINAAGAGVVASVVTDATGARLVMRSSETGESNGFRVSVTDADLNNTDASGLSALAFDPSAGVTSMTQKLAAGNANAVLNGLDIVSESNSLKNAIDGLDITLLKTTTADVTLSVNPDKEGLKKSINEFATAYNAVIGLMREQTKYDAATKTAGTLQGDSTVVGLQGQLRNLASGSTSLGGALSRLADIGLDPSADGTLKVNNTKLDKAMGDLDSLKSFFMGLDSGNAANDGLAQQIRRFSDEALNSEGRVTTKQQSLQDRISSNGKREAALELRMEIIEKRMRAQYTALDSTMGKLNSLSTYVSQQMALLNSNSSS